MRDWSRQDILGIAALVTGIVGCLASVMLPETREFLGLSPAGHQATPPPIQQSSTPIPAESPPVRSAAIPASSVPQVRESGTGTVAEEASETPGDMDVGPTPVQESKPISEEFRRELEARSRGEQTRGAPEAQRDEEEPRRERGDSLYAEQAARRHQASQRDQEELNKELEARSSGEQTRRAPDQPTISKGLVLFKVQPEDASLYLDGRFIGTPRDLEGGIWIETGHYSLDIVRPGYKGRKTSIVIDGNPLDVEVKLQRY